MGASHGSGSQVISKHEGYWIKYRGREIGGGKRRKKKGARQHVERAVSNSVRGRYGSRQDAQKSLPRRSQHTSTPSSTSSTPFSLPCRGRLAMDD